MELVPTRDLEAGEELTLDYGCRPMRDMLRGYGFTSVNAVFTDPSEEFEELGDACDALVVQGSGKVGPLTSVLPEVSGVMHKHHVALFARLASPRHCVLFLKMWVRGSLRHFSGDGCES